MTINFTAGTDGPPKPAVLRMENHFAGAVDAAFRFGIAPTDRWLVTHPLHHVCGFGPALRATLYGSTLLLADRLDPGALADALATYGATGVSVSPARLRAMLDARGTLSETLRVVLICGAPASSELLERCRGYSIPAYSAYTLTEAGGEVAAAPPTVGRGADGSVGRPMLRTDVTVVDDDGDHVGRGETGELVVAGPAISPGYYDPDEGGVIADRDRGVATGDLGYRDDDGRIWVLSRRGDLIEVDGEPVRADDVADVLAEHDAVVDAAVVGVPDEERGQGVGALVVARNDVGATALKDHCRARLASFVVPDRIDFAPSLPRSASGAVDRVAVRDRLLAGDAERVDPPETDSLVGRGSPPGIDSGRSPERGGDGASDIDVADR